MCQFSYEYKISEKELLTNISAIEKRYQFTVQLFSQFIIFLFDYIVAMPIGKTTNLELLLIIFIVGLLSFPYTCYRLSTQLFRKIQSDTRVREWSYNWTGWIVVANASVRNAFEIYFKNNNCISIKDELSSCIAWRQRSPSKDFLENLQTNTKPNVRMTSTRMEKTVGIGLASSLAWRLSFLR